jgi:acyl-CoA synthetase (NDP forming)
MRDLAKLFNPQTLAIVGASRVPSSISGQPLQHLLRNGFKGRVYPVNPRYDEIDDIPCYADLASLPEVPDLVLVVVAARHVPEVLEQCGTKGAKFAVILSSGFAEAGGAGILAQRQITEIAERFDLGVVGPNCQGMMNIAGDIRLGFGAPFGIPYRKGPVSLVSQSGAFGNAVLMLAEEGGLGFRHYLSTGNEACVTSLDVIEHLVADSGTKLIAAYVEGFKDAGKLAGVARTALASDKPLIVWKVGNSVSGAKAAASHTANICGEPALYRAAFRQLGVVEVDDIDELVDCAHGLLSGARPLGNRVAVVTLSGGAGIAMADRCEALRLTLPALSDETSDRLRPLLPAFASVQNPLDLTADIGSNTAAFEEVLRLVACDPNIDMIGLPMAALSGITADKFAEAIVRVRQNSTTPIFVSWNARPEDAAAAYVRLDAANVPRFRTPGRCARSLAAVACYAAASRDLMAASAEVPLVLSVPAARALLLGADETLTEHGSRKILTSYGLAAPRELLVESSEQAVSFGRELNVPIALKIQSPDLPHKSDVGGVRVGLREPSEIAEAFDEILANGRQFRPDARISGILVQEVIAGGTEVIIGIDNRSAFGPVVMFGLGGLYAEIFADVAFRLAPLTARDADRMIREVKCFKLLQGARGRPAADIAALREALLRVSALAIDLKDELAELDINPLFVMPEGGGVIVGDALIRPVRRGTGTYLPTAA